MGCKGSDTKAYAENNKIEMSAFNSQKDYNCDNAGGEMYRDNCGLKALYMRASITSLSHAWLV